MTTLAGTVLSLRVGSVGTLPWRDREVPTGFVKEAVDGAVALGADGLDGDEQADLEVHGGPDKAVCCYPSEHLSRWREHVGRELPAGAFGENLTLTGLTEDRVHIGDVFTLGTAVVQVTQPRGPCFKIAARWGVRELPGVIARELAAGFYLKVLTPGEVAAGDTMVLVERVSDVSVAEVLRVTYRDRGDAAALEAVMELPELAAQWRRFLVKLRDRNSLPLLDPVGDD